MNKAKILVVDDHPSNVKFQSIYKELVLQFLCLAPPLRTRKNNE